MLIYNCKNARITTPKPSLFGFKMFTPPVVNFTFNGFQGKLESYRQLKTNGKKLDADQIQAISKYEEVSATLDFARDVVKTMVSYALQAAQDQKFESQKQKEKELANIKLILELQVGFSLKATPDPLYTF